MLRVVRLDLGFTSSVLRVRQRRVGAAGGRPRNPIGRAYGSGVATEL